MQNNNRSNLIYVLTGALFFLLFPIHGFGKNSLDDHVFLSCKTQNSIEQKLGEGYRAFILNEGAAFQNILKETDLFLNNHEDEIITFILKNGAAGFLNKLEQSTAKQYLAIPGGQSPDDLAGCKSNGKRLFVFTPKATALSYSLKEKICEYRIPPDFPSEVAAGFSENKGNDLVIFHIDHVLPSLPDSLRQQTDTIPQLFNAYTGKLPNFFVTDNKEIFTAYHQNFAKKRWYSANAEYDGESLEGITWKELPQMTSFGKIHTTQGELSPYKNGFHFSPDVFNFNRLTSGSTKIFYAQQKNIKEEMVLCLTFEQSTENLAGKNTEIPYSKVEYKKDPQRGWCGDFNSRDNYIDFDKNIVFNENFTVSVWINPSNIHENKSIIGKGKALSVKFRNGKMLFTSPGIKDHETDSALVIPDQWQHLTYVISSGETVKFYKNGKLVEAQEAERIEPTEHSLLVGTNLWDESYKGLMDDLIIWNRNLSDEEIKRLYEQGLDEGKHFRGQALYWLLIPVLIAILTFIFIRLKKKHQSKTATKNINNLASNKHEIKAPSVELFGGFRIINRNKEDLTTRFSPRRKQFFILVLIETLKKQGISSKQLTNHLWAGYSSESAKNNRSTQVQRMRETLALKSGINIAYADKKWVINLENDVYCDITDYFRLTEEFKQTQEGQLNFNLLAQILFIIEKGPLLPNMDDEWLDDFKSNITDEILDNLLPLFSDDEFMQKTDWIIRLSRALLIFDPLNETVLKHHIKTLVKLGKNTQAHEALEHFEKVYRQCYAQDFSKTISDIIE